MASKDMRAIALVTLAFLAGTFIAVHHMDAWIVRKKDGDVDERKEGLTKLGCAENYDEASVFRYEYLQHTT